MRALDSGFKGAGQVASGVIVDRELHGAHNLGSVSAHYAVPIPAELDLFWVMIERRHDKTQQVLRELRSIAYSRALTAPDQMRRIRDTLGKHYGVFDDPDEPL
jgi:hypothetical protein